MINSHLSDTLHWASNLFGSHVKSVKVPSWNLKSRKKLYNLIVKPENESSRFTKSIYYIESALSFYCCLSTTIFRWHKNVAYFPVVSWLCTDAFFFFCEFFSFEHTKLVHIPRG